MKAPRPRIHLKDTDAPILDYSNVEVRCGQILKNAEPKWMVTDDFLPLSFGTESYRSMMDCRNCVARPALKPGRSYLYGLVDAQAERDAENLGASEGDNENEPN